MYMFFLTLLAPFCRLLYLFVLVLLTDQIEFSTTDKNTKIYWPNNKRSQHKMPAKHVLIETGTAPSSPK